MSQVHLRLLGTLQIEIGGKTTTRFRSRRAAALLIFLIATQRPVARSELVELIWPDKNEKQGRGNLRWALSYLTKLLPDALERTRQSICFSPPANYSVDIHQIDKAFKQANWQQLGEYLQAMQGMFLDDFFFDESADFETWLVTQREAWRLRIFQALESLINFHNSLSQHDSALQFAQKWLTIEPWSENAHRWAMQLFARLGRYDAAQEQYERCWRVLAEELGTEPTDETTELFEKLKQSADIKSPELPSQPTPFVGRSAEIDSLVELLADKETRLVTLLGPGGMGKTRLAIAAATQLTGSFIDGVIFVELAQIDDEKNIVASILSALEQSGTISANNASVSATHRLQQTLRAKEMLLILDNFEHVINGATQLIDILHSAPNIKLLVTSRERMNLRWERLHIVEGLTDEAAFELFVQAASHAHPSFEVDQSNRAAIQQICKLVEGMPLGIELAAAWIRMQTCQQIAETVQKDLSLLTSSKRDLPNRHRSMQAVFTSSWRLLSAEEQKSLSELSIFVGGFSAEAAQEIVGASWTTLAPLVDKSLLRQSLSGGAKGTKVRYKMHELLRQFSAETLSAEQLAAAKIRHTKFYANFLDALNEQTQLGDKLALDQIEIELANIKQAWRWSIELEAIDLLYLANIPLAYFFDMRSRSQESVQTSELAVTMLEQLNRPDDIQVQIVLAMVRVSLGNALSRLQRYDESELQLRRSLAFFEQINYSLGMIFSLFALARIFSETGDHEQARKLHLKSYHFAELDNDLVGMARNSVNLADIAYKENNVAEGQRLSAESLALFKEIGDQRGIAVALLNVARGEQTQGNTAKAQNLVNKCLAIAQDISAISVIASAYTFLGEIAVQEKAWDLAESYFKSASEHYENLGNIEDLTAIQIKLEKIEQSAEN